MATNPNPIKVSELTKERVRLIAAITNRTQAQVLDEAVDQFVERHAEDFSLGLKEARQALFGGTTAAVAYLLDEDPEKVARVSAASDKPVKK